MAEASNDGYNSHGRNYQNFSEIKDDLGLGSATPYERAEELGGLEVVTKVTFDRPLDDSGIDELFNHLASKGLESVYCTSRERSAGKEGSQIRGYSASGSFLRAQPHVGAGFRSFRDCEGQRIQGLRFEITPGYDLREHREEDVQLWLDVRDEIRRYFASKEETRRVESTGADETGCRSGNTWNAEVPLENEGEDDNDITKGWELEPRT